MGRSGPPTEPVEEKIRELEKGSASLEEEALNLQSVRASIERDGGTPSGLYEQQWLRLDAIGTRLKELEAEMQEKSQLAKEREDATAALAEAGLQDRTRRKTRSREPGAGGTQADAEALAVPFSSAK